VAKGHARGGRATGTGKPIRSGSAPAQQALAGETSASALPLSALDILLIAFGAIFLIATVVLLRRVRPPISD
jgi:hypothetical protein